MAYACRCVTTTLTEQSCPFASVKANNCPGLSSVRILAVAFPMGESEGSRDEDSSVTLPVVFRRYAASAL
eukprot:5604502-Pyramimonas_sp.AAC.1